jgi:allantoin racemase
MNVGSSRGLRIRVINPNTTEAMTETIADAAPRVALPTTEISAAAASAARACGEVV